VALIEMNRTAIKDGIRNILDNMDSLSDKDIESLLLGLQANREDEFIPVAKRKLKSLLDDGWHVCGVAISRETRFGCCTYGGRVLWWHDTQ
jgi:hypothetical protein